MKDLTKKHLTPKVKQTKRAKPKPVTAKAEKKSKAALAKRDAKQAKNAKPAKVTKTTKPAKTVPVLGKPKEGAQVLPENLTDAINAIKRAAARRSTLPVLGNLLIVADKGRQQFKIAATNLEIAEWRWIPGVVKDDFSICVPYEIADLAAHLPTDQPLSLVVTEKDATMRLTQDGFNATLKGIDPKEFPVIPTGGDAQHTVASFEFSRDQLAEIVARVLPCAATDESRPVLTAVFVNVLPGKGHNREVDFACADGFRLARVTQNLPVTIKDEKPAPKAIAKLAADVKDASPATKNAKPKRKGRGKQKDVVSDTTSPSAPAPTSASAPTSAPAPDKPEPSDEAKAAKPAAREKPYYAYSCLIPPLFFQEALKIANDDEPLVVEVISNGGQVTCQNKTGGVTNHTVDGIAPDYTRIIPDSENMEAIPLPLAETRQAIACASVYAECSMNTLHIRRDGNAVVLHASGAELGDYERTIPVKFGNHNGKFATFGPENHFKTALNIRYLKEALSAATWDDGDEPLELLVQSTSSPVLIQRKGFDQVIVPMHVEKDERKKEKAFNGVTEATPKVTMQAVSTATPALPAPKPTEQDPAGESIEDPRIAAVTPQTGEHWKVEYCVMCENETIATHECAGCGASLCDKHIGSSEHTCESLPSDEEVADTTQQNKTDLQGLTGDDVAKVFTVTCECGGKLEVRQGNSAVCECGAIVDDKGNVIFKQDAA